MADERNDLLATLLDGLPEAERAQIAEQILRQWEAERRAVREKNDAAPAVSF